MSNEQLMEIAGKLLPDATLSTGTQYIEVSVAAGALHSTAALLKNSPELAFDYMVCLSGVDFADHMKVVYHLESTSHRHMIVLKASTAGRENPSLDTVCDLWPTAEFHEREVFDLLGIRFNNHPDLRRLFLGDEWGFPLRKDYKDDIHVVER